ncbi:InlB B-repeat-containing protein, partial [Porphyromonas sp.]|uniref:InlB B-repeat-containing protein n=1 Tax=Porphyromonas sp. TaxID=1924944 RepID=UPI003AB7B3BC
MKRMLSMLALLGTFLLMPLVAQAQKYTVTFEQVEHCTITASYRSGGSTVEVQSGDQVTRMTYLTIKATPEEGYMVTHYIINGVEEESKGTSINKMVFEDLTISARVIQVRPCTVTITQPEHGTLKVTSGGREVQPGSQINSGSMLALELTPEAGYEIEYWIVNGKKSLPNADPTSRNKAFLKLMDDITIAAQLKAEGTTTKVPVTIVNPEFATIKAYKGTSSSDPELQSGEQLEVGSDLMVEITPSDNAHALDHWLINDEPVEKDTGYFSNQKRLKVVEAMTISAVLKESGYKITYNQPEHGTLTVKVAYPSSDVPSGSRVKERTRLNISATVEAGYQFKHFLINGEVKVPTNLTYPNLRVEANSDMTIEAVIEKPEPCVVTITPFEHGTLTVKYGTYSSSTVVANGDEVPMNTSLTLEAKVDPDYEFKHFLIDGVETPSTYYSDYLKTYSCTYRLTKSVTIAVVAEKKPTTKVTIEPFEHGELEVSYGPYGEETMVKTGDEVPQGTKLDIYAGFDDGYDLDHFLVNGEQKPADKPEWGYIGVTVGDTPLTLSAVAKKTHGLIVMVQPDAAQGAMTAHYTDNGQQKDLRDSTWVALQTPVTFVVTPKEGYEMASWKVDGQTKPLESADPNQLTLTVTADFKVEPVLKAKAAPQPTTYTVTLTQPDATQGTMTAHYTNDDTKAVTDGMSVEKDTQVTFVVVPAEGYEMASWMVDGQPKALESADPNQLTLTVTDNLKVEPVLKAKVVKYTVTMTQPAATQGTMTAHYTNDATKAVTDGMSVEKDTQVTFVVVPAEGYEMASWKVDGQSKALESADPNQLTLTVTDNLKVEPVLKETVPLVKHTVTLGELPDEKGSFYALYGSEGTIVRNGQKLPEGTEVSFHVDAAEGYELDYWMVDDVKSDDTSNPLVITLSKDIKVVPVMKEKAAPQPTDAKITMIQPEHGKMTASYYDDEEYETFDVIDGGRVNLGVNVTFVVTPNEGYEMDYWMVDDERQELDTETPNKTIITVTGDLKVEPVLKVKAAPQPTKYTVTMIQPKEGQGTMTAYYYNKTGDKTALTTGNSVAEGTYVTFEVTPAEGYEMDHWMIDDQRVEETSSTKGITVKANLKVEPVLKAKAAPQPTTGKITIIQPKVEEGTMSVYTFDGYGDYVFIKDGQSVKIGTDLTFKVTPKEGYEMDYWMVNDERQELSTSTPNQKTITVTGNLKVEPVLKAKATPQPVEYTITMIQPNSKEGTMVAYTYDSDGNVKTVVSGMTVKSGTKVTFAVGLKEGYEMDYWMVNDQREELEGGDYPNKKTITVTGDLKVEPILKAKAAPQPKTVLVKISYEGTGAYLETTYLEPGGSGNPLKIFGDKDIPVGSVVTVRLKSFMAGDYQVVYTNNGNAVPAETLSEDGLVYTFTANEDAHVHGVISEKPAPAVDYTITFEAGEGGKVTATVDMEPIESGAKIAAGTQIKILAEPNENYEIDQWL